MENDPLKILENFDLGSEIVHCEQFGNGHINWTYQVETRSGEQFVLQRINTYVFRDPEGLMRNIELLTSHMRKKTTDPRQVLQLIPAKDGKNFIVTDNGEYWRVYVFVGDSICYDNAPSLELFKEGGRAFGNFQNWLADFPVETLVETIPNFHNTVSRYRDFEKSLAETELKDRKEFAKPEIEYVLSQKPWASFLLDKVDSGEIPLRVTHNDTKINNVLFDRTTGKALCVVDLDTTMPGIASMDFGDGIRYAGNNAAEDEKDLDKVFLRMDLFEAYAEGFCGECKELLTEAELMLCPEASKIITLETGMRFLADYLDGDVYFQTAYPEHNLVRARTQFKLAADMDRNMDRMRDIIRDVLK